MRLSAINDIDADQRLFKLLATTAAAKFLSTAQPLDGGDIVKACW